MQKKLLLSFNDYRKNLKKQIDEKLRAKKYKTVLNTYQILADIITNTSIVLLILLVIFLMSIMLSFSFSVFFDSHVKGFLAATFSLTLLALLVLWKRPVVERYFAGIGIARYFEKLKKAENQKN